MLTISGFHVYFGQKSARPEFSYLVRLFNPEANHDVGIIPVQVAGAPHQLNMSVDLEARKWRVTNGEEETSGGHVTLWDMDGAKDSHYLQIAIV